MKSIYFDNAASAPMLESVVQSMSQVLMEMTGNPSGTHKHGRKCRAAIEKSRKSIAENFNASIGEIFFTSGGTESNNTALNCSVDQYGVQRIITTPIEHPSVLNTLSFLKTKRGIQVEFLAVDNMGRIDLSELENKINAQNDRTLVSIMHANNEIGVINPIAEIGEICKSNNILFHTDAVQTVGHLPIDLNSMYISFLSASGHKFHGPKGIGFLYVNSNNIIQPFINGGSQERNVRGGTENLAGIVGMAEALEYCKNNLDKKRQHVVALRQYFIEKIKTALPPTVKIMSMEDPEDCLYTILNIMVPQTAKSDLLLMNLDIAGISASGGSACSSGAEKGSHVIGAITNNKQAGKSVRFSFSFLNTTEEVSQTIEVLKKSL